MISSWVGPRRATAARRPERLVAAVLGGLGVLLAVLVPFLPVVQDTATITWPSPTTGTASVNAPLVAYRPETMRAAIPCGAVRDLDARSPGPATVLATTPPGSPTGPSVGMALTVADGTLALALPGAPAVSGPVPAGPCTVSITSDGTATTVDLAGARTVVPGDVRPQVVGVYSDLDQGRDDVAGTSVSITPDTRFQTSPTTVKVLAAVAAALATAGAVWALARIDRRTGRRPVARRRWRPTVPDGVVAGTLVVWAVIGSPTPDDGYIAGIARARESAGYIGNYYRWFNVPEAPFGWSYELFALMTRVSDAMLWLRLPALALGIGSWLLIAHGLLPRLGVRVRRSRAAVWAAAGVFVLFWLPYDDGLRPEPVVVAATLVALLTVERSVATRRVAPLGVGLVAAGLALAAAPTGLVAFAPFLAALRPLARLLVDRGRRAGWLAVLLPLLAAGVVVLVVVFADQTIAAVAEASRVRFALGPAAPWNDEISRYVALLAPVDGPLARRVPVLLMLLGLGVCAVVLLRRGRLPGAALGPSRRLLGATLIGLLLLVLTPTKWTHHFGAFAALGAGVAALTAVACSKETLRAPRDRLLVLAALAAVLALAFTGVNSWWYASDWGVPWVDRPIALHGVALSDVALLVTALLLLAAAVVHAFGGERLRGRVPVAGVLVTVAALVVVFEVGSLAKAVDKVGGWSPGGDVLAHPLGGSCGLSGQVRLPDGRPFVAAVGDAPVYMEWPVPFANPCLQPFGVRDGIAEVPRYRLIGDSGHLKAIGSGWATAGGGGPLGWIDVLAREVEVPATFDGEPTRDWGQLWRLEPYRPDAVAPTVVTGHRTVWGWTDQARLGAPPSTPADDPTAER